MCHRTRQDTTEDVVCIEELRSNTERELEFVNMIQYLPVSEATQIAIKQATESNATLRDLKTVIREGWPGTGKHQQLFPLSGRAVIAEWTCVQR